MYMIEVKHISKTYGKKDSLLTALDNVSFSIPEGSTVAIIGKSGSGKSTLMHIMSGLDHPNDGQIVIAGKVLHDLKGKAMDSFRATEMSFIFQSFFVEANQTCFQNVSLPLEISELKQRKTKVIEALEAVELLDKINAKASELSGGQKQRLAIARAIVNKPQLIFADEPTGNLDSVTGDKIIDLLFKLNKTNKNTLIIVTHDDELAAKCQIRITLKDGKIIDFKQRKKVSK
ncbi:MAG: ABC transporter ATP-binding protein [Candidatus Saccharibacteria bacterium]